MSELSVLSGKDNLQHIFSDGSTTSFHIDRLRFDCLLEESNNLDKARLRATACSIAASWLQVTPSISQALDLTPPQFRVLCRMWLGLAIFPPNHKCGRCNSDIDLMVFHAITCQYGGHRGLRHDMIISNLFSLHLRSKYSALTTVAKFASSAATRSKFNVAVFSTKTYDRDFLSAQLAKLRDPDISLTFNKQTLSLDTVDRAVNSQAICIFVNDRCDKPVVEKLSKMGVKMVALRCAGFNNVDLKATNEHSIKVSRVPAYSPYGVAEFSVASLLSLNRKIHIGYERVLRHNFSLENLVGFDVHGKTVGIIGAGKIGQCTIAIYKGMGCRVLAYDAFPNLDAAKDLKFEFVQSLDEIYKQCDIVSIHAPLTADNHHMINAASIEKMKTGVMIINCGRGPLVDTRALLAGLKSGHIKGACLDVYENESEYFYDDHSHKIIADDLLSQLIACPNVLLTSHQAFLTEDALTNISESTMASIQEVAHNKKLSNEVTPS
ncbi:hypothetical protein GJ496_003586 [Pomphorhynchus laevis]|nr:hypothetical protein GJ496_003586 [Pomphorhynchus laevis]